MGIRLVGNPQQTLNAFVAQKKKRAPKALMAAALLLEGTTKQILSTPGTGKIRRSGRDRIGRGSFRRSKDGKLHMVRRGAARTNIDNTNRASAPGEPPAPDTNLLRGSITHDVVTPNQVRVGTNVVYAKPLEFGTLKIKPRPFMRPAFAQARAQMTAEVIGVLSTGDSSSG